jgi:hypothetical protein
MRRLRQEALRLFKQVYVSQTAEATINDLKEMNENPIRISGVANAG